MSSFSDLTIIRFPNLGSFPEYTTTPVLEERTSSPKGASIFMPLFLTPVLSAPNLDITLPVTGKTDDNLDAECEIAGVPLVEFGEITSPTDTDSNELSLSES